MIYVYRRSASDSARSLAEALGGRRIRDLSRINPRPDDLIVCWGEGAQGDLGCEYLNIAAIKSKYDDAVRLKVAGVPTIEVARHLPTAVPVAQTVDPAIAAWIEAQELAEEFRQLHFSRGEIVLAGLRELTGGINRLDLALRQPVPVAVPTVPIGDWIGRLNNHTGGIDLLNPPQRPDYYVRKETFISEYRVHSFDGRSIRAGKKIPRAGVENPHQWIRSWDGGWRISYDGDAIRQRHRDLAHQAVSVLDLTFGAVDIGERADRSLCVLEVNRAPGLEGGTIGAYANAILAWME